MLGMERNKMEWNGNIWNYLILSGTQWNEQIIFIYYGCEWNVVEWVSFFNFPIYQIKQNNSVRFYLTPFQSILLIVI